MTKVVMIEIAISDFLTFQIINLLQRAIFYFERNSYNVLLSKVKAETIE